VRQTTTGCISILGSPSGATVYIDGSYISNIPCTLYDISAGKHKLKVQEDGYKDWEQWIEVIPAKTISVIVELEE